MANTFQVFAILLLLSRHPEVIERDTHAAFAQSFDEEANVAGGEAVVGEAAYFLVIDEEDEGAVGGLNPQAVGHFALGDDIGGQPATRV